MSPNPFITAPFLAVDIGNARIKLGLFDPPINRSLPEPRSVLHLSDETLDLAPVAQWLEESLGKTDRTENGQNDLSWWIGSVNREVASRLIVWLRDHRPDDRVTMMAVDDLPLTVDLPQPDRVGIDRLLDAVTANRLREPNRPAVVIDVGTAITVDLVSAEGIFLGGAILPGIAMSAQALHDYTDLLPLVDMVELQSSPPALGTETLGAMRSGLFWGAVGAIRELCGRLAPGDVPQIFLTGGAGSSVAELLGQESQHMPHLTLAGIALSVLSQQQV